LGGMVIMLWNTLKTATNGRAVDVQIPVVDQQMTTAAVAHA
jgi:hypothetical protein